MATKYSVEKAAQAWCKKSTKKIQMDVKLAWAFAEILDEEIEKKKICPDCGYPKNGHKKTTK